MRSNVRTLSPCAKIPIAKYPCYTVDSDFLEPGANSPASVDTLCGVFNFPLKEFQHYVIMLM